MDTQFLFLFFFFLSVFGFITFILLKDYKKLKALRFKRYIPLALFLWFLFFILMYIHSNPALGQNEGGLKLHYVTGILFVIFNILFLVYIRVCMRTNFWILLLFVPMAILFMCNLIIFNVPYPQGALDGIAMLIIMSYMEKIFITFPIFIFSFSMIKFNNLTKGIILILISIITGFAGIEQTIGIEGYLSDFGGGGFCAIIFLLFMTGIIYLFKKPLHRLTNPAHAPKEK
tara:strand:- start:2616 stop:3305 length:690 start_codon:yes stop_codon:yes gene_type:complete